MFDGGILLKLIKIFLLNGFCYQGEELSRSPYFVKIKDYKTGKVVEVGMSAIGTITDKDD